MRALGRAGVGAPVIAVVGLLALALPRKAFAQG